MRARRARSWYAGGAPARDHRFPAPHFARHLPGSHGGGVALAAAVRAGRGEAHPGAIDLAVPQSRRVAVAHDPAVEELEALADVEVEVLRLPPGELSAPLALYLGRHDPEVHLGGPGAGDLVLLLGFNRDRAVRLPVLEVKIVRDDP